MKLLFDADIYAYRAAVLSEREVDWGNDLWTLASDMKEAFGRFEAAVYEDIARMGGDPRDLVLCFSDPAGNWRKKENPGYKKNRIGNRKPLAYRPLVDYINTMFPTLTMPGLEADDVMGIMGTHRPDETVVVSIDKDMLTLPATVFNPDKMNVPTVISREEADAYFWQQALTGDPTDGYPGCPGIGPVTAQKILSKVDITDEVEVWCEVVRVYESKGRTLEDAVLNARMARICRYGDWDAIRKEMTWNPPNV